MEMHDLASKVPAGAVWTLSGLLIVGLLKGFSVFVNKFMDRHIKRDEYSHDSSKDIIARVWAKVEAQEAKIQALNSELDTAYGKYHEAMKHLEVQAVHLQHCRGNATELCSEIVDLKNEIARLHEPPKS
jgi:hypothetical protein